MTIIGGKSTKIVFALCATRQGKRIISLGAPLNLKLSVLPHWFRQHLNDSFPNQVLVLIALFSPSMDPVFDSLADTKFIAT